MNDEKTIHPQDECRACANDAEQCHEDLDCEARAQGNGYCFKHQPDPRRVAEPVE